MWKSWHLTLSGRRIGLQERAREGLHHKRVPDRSSKHVDRLAKHVYRLEVRGGVVDQLNPHGGISLGWNRVEGSP